MKFTAHEVYKFRKVWLIIFKYLFTAIFGMAILRTIFLFIDGGGENVSFFTFMQALIIAALGSGLVATILAAVGVQKDRESKK